MPNIKIKLPYRIGQTVMLNLRREKRTIDSFELTVNSQGETVGIRIGTNYGSYPIDCIKTDAEWREVDMSVPYAVGDDIIYHNDSRYRNHILKRGKVDSIQITFGDFGKLVYVYVKGAGSIDRHNRYRSKEDFIERTKPTHKLKEGQKYIFTKYCIEQNKLQPVTVDKLTKTHSEYYHAGEYIKKRNCFLFNSHESFVNRMTAQI